MSIATGATADNAKKLFRLHHFPYFSHMNVSKFYEVLQSFWMLMI